MTVKGHLITSAGSRCCKNWVHFTLPPVFNFQHFVKADKLVVFFVCLFVFSSILYSLLMLTCYFISYNIWIRLFFTLKVSMVLQKENKNSFIFFYVCVPGTDLSVILCVCFCVLFCFLFFFPFFLVFLVEHNQKRKSKLKPWGPCYISTWTLMDGELFKRKKISLESKEVGHLCGLPALCGGRS